MKAHVCLFMVALSGAAVARQKPPPPAPPPPPDPNKCMPAIEAAEKKFQLPEKLLGTIALVESGQPDPDTGRVVPWPWTIDAQGQGWFFPTKAEAIAAVLEYQAAGVQSIDVGCMQINLMYHPDAFASLDEAFDPAANAMYGARFLSALYHQTTSWPQAAAAYHSQTPDIGQGYELKVMALWPLAYLYPDPVLPPAPLGPPSTLIQYPTAAAAAAAAAAKRDKKLEEEQLTPEFAARTRQIDADLAKLAAQLGPALEPKSPANPAVRAVSARGPNYPRPGQLLRGAAGSCVASSPACSKGPG
jgi:hypothetical protein